LPPSTQDFAAIPGQRATSPWFNVTLSAAAGADIAAAGFAMALAQASANAVNSSVRTIDMVDSPRALTYVSLHRARGTPAERQAAEQWLKNAL
jgi:hypothetical protein